MIANSAPRFFQIRLNQDAIDAVAEPEHEEWVMQEWKRFQGVSP